jgi:hypothetical protein
MFNEKANGGFSRPDFVTDEMLSYLDGVRASGIKDTRELANRLFKKFDDLTLAEVLAVIAYWLLTYGEEDR